MVTQGVISAGSGSDNQYNHCPCGIGQYTKPAPSFVGSDYYCEAGGNSNLVDGLFYVLDPLWDGKNCGSSETACCQRTLIPWFYKSIAHSTIDILRWGSAVIKIQGMRMLL